MSRLTKTVAGITLHKTMGRGHHRWITTLATQSVIFTPWCGRYNNKPNRWRANSHQNMDGTNLDDTRFDTRFHVEANSLTECARLAHIEAHRRMREIWHSERSQANG